MDVPCTETWKRGYVNRLWHTQREERLTEGLFIRCGQSEMKQCRRGSTQELVAGATPEGTRVENGQ